MGARHALDPDHLAAVSVLAADDPDARRGALPGARRGALLGALWGVGHAVALLGTGLVLGAVAAELPSALADVFELAVAVMLIVLGARAVHRALRSANDGPTRLHAHAGHSHRHAGPRAHLHVARRTLALRPRAASWNAPSIHAACKSCGNWLKPSSASARTGSRAGAGT